MGQHELRTLQRLVSHGLSKSKRHERRYSGTDSIPIHTQEHLGSSLPMGRHTTVLQDLFRPNERKRMECSATPLLRHDLRLQHGRHRSNSHRRQFKHVPLLRRRQRKDLPRLHADRKFPEQLRHRINYHYVRYYQ